MDIKSIKELLDSMSNSDLNYLEIESDGLHITLKKEMQDKPDLKDIMEVSDKKVIEVKQNQKKSKLALKKFKT